MKTVVHKLITLIYTGLIIFCLTRLALLEQNKLAQILEIMLAAVTVIKTLHSISISSISEDCEATEE